MKSLFKKISAISLVFVFTLVLATAFSATNNNKPVTDLTKAYEAWTNKGIKFVVRNEKGQFVTWNIGRLEAWAGKSKWVIRNTKGHFITHAHGKVENWKNGKTRLVLRDKKGRMLTHIGIKITDRASFASNVVGLRHLKNKRFLAFVQDMIADVLVKELKKDRLTKTKVLISYLKKYQKEKGTKNFKPILRRVLPKLNFMANEKPNSKTLKTLSQDARELLKKL